MGSQRVGDDWATELNWKYKHGGGILFITASYWKNPKWTTKGNGYKEMCILEIKYYEIVQCHSII